MAIVTISEIPPLAASASGPARTQAAAWCAQLEAGDFLFFPSSPIALAADDVSFLLGRQQADSSLHKNIAYKPAAQNGAGVLSGLDTMTADAAAVDRLRGIRIQIHVRSLAELDLADLSLGNKTSQVHLAEVQ